MYSCYFRIQKLLIFHSTDSGIVASVTVTDCSGKTECILHKGKNYTIGIDFKASKLNMFNSVL